MLFARFSHNQINNLLYLVGLVAFFGLLGCQLPPTENRLPENFLHATAGIYTGGEPTSAHAFAQLKQRGIRMVVSVDGKSPNVELAKQYGLRYVHIPLGYDGISNESALTLVSALKKNGDRPIYFHCHHGTHRAPSAAAIAAIGTQRITKEEAIQLLKTAGTGAEYQGLWNAVKTFTPPPENIPLPSLVERATVPDFTTLMATTDRAFDNLKRLSKNGWMPLPAHPDLEQTQEAIILWESIKESQRFVPEDTNTEFNNWLHVAANDAKRLHHALEEGDAELSTTILKRLKRGCIDCHGRYRN